MSICRVTLFFCWLLISPCSFSVEPPPLTLAHDYHDDIDLTQYWVSEKLDGVRAYWNGTQLLSRQGNAFHPPQWFIQQLPDIALDGELWLARGHFEKTVSIVKKHQAIDAEWRKIRYMIFDLPHSKLPFTDRLTQLQQQLNKNNAVVQVIPQYKVNSHQALQEKLAEVVSHGGEGLMLHRGGALYRAGRNHDLLKLKPYYDAEATVIGHNFSPTLGKNTLPRKLKSLIVELGNGLQFRIGTGFTQQQRLHPPAIGSIITFKHYGLTRRGIPRHASFMRIRTDQPL